MSSKVRKGDMAPQRAGVTKLAVWRQSGLRFAPVSRLLDDVIRMFTRYAKVLSLEVSYHLSLYTNPTNTERKLPLNFGYP